MKIILFIEGDKKVTNNGNLRSAFSSLLRQKCTNCMPQIIMGDGKSTTIKKFLKNKLPCDLALLLVDLDKSESEMEKDLKENNLQDYKDNVFYVVRETESWFLSQPEILDKFYGLDVNGKKISDKITKKKAIDFEEPDKVINNLIKNTQNRKFKEYQKMKESVQLIQLLNADKLMIEFSEFNRLILRIASNKL